MQPPFVWYSHAFAWLTCIFILLHSINVHSKSSHWHACTSIFKFSFICWTPDFMYSNISCGEHEAMSVCFSTIYVDRSVFTVHCCAFISNQSTTQFELTEFNLSHIIIFYFSDNEHKHKKIKFTKISGAWNTSRNLSKFVEMRYVTLVSLALDFNRTQIYLDSIATEFATKTIIKFYDVYKRSFAGIFFGFVYTYIDGVHTHTSTTSILNKDKILREKVVIAIIVEMKCILNRWLTFFEFNTSSCKYQVWQASMHYVFHYLENHSKRSI